MSGGPDNLFRLGAYPFTVGRLMDQHGKQIVVHVFRLAAGPGDNPYENVAIIGPFDKLAEAVATVRRAGWRCHKSMPELDPNEWGWTRPLSDLSVEFRPLTRRMPLR